MPIYKCIVEITDVRVTVSRPTLTDVACCTIIGIISRFLGRRKSDNLAALREKRCGNDGRSRCL